MPHDMKKVLILFLALAAITSCKMKNEAESTPMFYFSYFLRSDSTHTDTLYCVQTSSNTILVDTARVADTITFGITADAVLNVLDSLSVTWNHSKMSATFAVKNEWFIPELTDVANGHFKFLPYYRGVTMPMTYVPTVAGTDTITLFLRSSTTVYGPTSMHIIQPVR